MYVVVAGAGKVGYHLSKALIAEGHEVVLVEKDREHAQHIADELGSVVIPHAADEGRWLMEAGVERADVVVAATGDDEDNLIICQLAELLAIRKGSRKPRTIARVNHPKNEAVLIRLGVDATVSTTSTMLQLIEEELSPHPTVHLMTLRRAGIELMECTIPRGAPSLGKRVQDLSLPAGVSVPLVVRDGETTQLDAGSPLQVGDRVIVLLPISAEAQVRAVLASPTR